MSVSEKEKALAKFLGVDEDEVSFNRSMQVYEADGSSEYRVLTNDEADRAAREYIEESLWAFNASFISAHSKALRGGKALEAFAKMQAELCEDANDLVRGMIDDFDHFVKDAIKADGRGHFLSPYDGEESESGKFFIYRVN